MRTASIIASLAVVLVAAPVLADIPPPSTYVETCTIANKQTATSECLTCSAYYGDTSRCSKLLNPYCYQSLCKSWGASVWSEVLCRTKAANAPVVPSDIIAGLSSATGIVAPVVADGGAMPTTCAPYTPPTGTNTTTVTSTTTVTKSGTTTQSSTDSKTATITQSSTDSKTATTTQSKTSTSTDSPTETKSATDVKTATASQTDTKSETNVKTTTASQTDTKSATTDSKSSTATVSNTGTVTLTQIATITQTSTQSATLATATGTQSATLATATGTQTSTALNKPSDDSSGCSVTTGKSAVRALGPLSVVLAGLALLALRRRRR